MTSGGRLGVVIDSHQHFWSYDAGEFGWIGEEMRAIRRDFGPGELEGVMRANGLDRVVSVQARQSEEETGWLLGMAREKEWIAGVVGWVPLLAGDVRGRLEKYMASGKLVGVRHVLQGEADGFMGGEAFNHGLEVVGELGLAYDVLVVERQLPEVIGLVDRHPGVRFVLDHLGKPRNDLREMEPWARNVRELARRENVWCKVSGGMTEVELGWTEASVRPYFDVAMDAFGARRLMFGSNWPVTEAAGGYGKWIGVVRDWAEKLSESERVSLFGGAAVEVYGLEVM